MQLKKPSPHPLPRGEGTILLRVGFATGLNIDWHGLHLKQLQQWLFPQRTNLIQNYFEIYLESSQQFR